MSLKKWQKIYVNRSLNMGSIKSIGFDMDHTLAPYNHINFEAVAFEKTLDKFIAAGYPKELQKLQFDPTSVIRGLLVDHERGNLLKVDAHKYVKTAFHGKRRLDKEERHRLYNSESFKAENLKSVDTFFSLSEVQLFVEIVDFMDRHPGRIKKSYAEIYHDLRHYIDLSHADGSIKDKVMATPSHYIKKDKHLCGALKRLISGGKSLFLLTNSGWEYTDAIMGYLLNDTLPEDFKSWRDFFDLVIVNGQKPKFFTSKNPFEEINISTGESKVCDDTLKRGYIYAKGNAAKLQEVVGIVGDEVLYVGDHIYGDIISSKGLVNWRTMLIVEELEHELHRLEETKGELEKIQDSLREREVLDEELQKLRSLRRSLDFQLKNAAGLGDKKKSSHLLRELEKLDDKVTEKEEVLTVFNKTIKNIIEKREKQIHPVWGELMKVNLEKSRFAQQVETYACIYSSSVTNLRFYSPFKQFISFHDILPHDIA